MATSHSLVGSVSLAQFVWVIVLAASVLLLIVFRELRRRRSHWSAGSDDIDDAVRAADQFTLTRAAFFVEALDVAAEAHAMLRQLDGVARREWVRFQLAVQPGLTVRTDVRAFREILAELLNNAIHHSPGGCVLFAAMLHGGRVQIAVTDDGVGLDRATQEASLRHMQPLVALQGGTLELTIDAGGHTTAVIRFPAPPEARRAVHGAGPTGIVARERETVSAQVL